MNDVVERAANAIKGVMHHEDDTDPDAVIRYARAAIYAVADSLDELVDDRRKAKINGNNSTIAGCAGWLRLYAQQEQKKA